MSGDDPLQALVELAAPEAHDVCLDFGAGVGRATFAVAPLVDRVEAVDSDAEVLSEAERLGKEVGADGVRYRRTDLSELPWDGPTFDLILCDMVLHRLLEPVRTLRELARVMRPDGRLIVVDVCVDEATDRYVNELARLREPAHWRHYRAEEYEHMFEEADLRATDTRVLRQSVDVDAWAEAGLAGRAGLELIGARLRSYPVNAQVALDVAYADRRASFSFDVTVVRLEAGDR